jgi:hypothetical protein
MKQTNKRLLTTFLVLLALGIPWTNTSAGPDPQTEWITLSGRGVILAGGNFVDVSLKVPACPRNREFLALGVHVSPEVFVGATSMDAVNLPKWAASVPVIQRFTGTTTQVALTVLGQGPEHLSATLPAGQSIGGFNALIVRIILLGGTPASHRFEFNVHVTGACGSASIMP